jgi:hypothetical protein
VRPPELPLPTGTASAASAMREEMVRYMVPWGEIACDDQPASQPASNAVPDKPKRIINYCDLCMIRDIFAA